MKKSIPLFLLLIGFAVSAHCVPLDTISEDDAAQEDYNSGFSTGKNGGNGFGKWNLCTRTGEGEHSHAGFYVASAQDKPDLNGVGSSGKAWGFYANGTSFEEAVGFRAFDRPLQPGQSFSLQMEHGRFARKFDSDSPDPGSCGFTLLPDVSGVTNTGDYHKEARFQFAYDVAENAYVIVDGDGKKKLDVPFTDAGLSMTVTLVSADLYNLEVTVLSTRQTIRLEKRKLGGTAGAPVRGFCLFDRNSETYDVYFNGLQVLQKPQ